MNDSAETSWSLKVIARHTSFAVIAALVLISACATGQVRVDGDRARVPTEAGVLVGRLEGDILTFKGVPYAAPPVGDLRWAPAAPAPSWHGERQANAFSAACPQPDFANLPEGAQTAGEAWVMWTGAPMAPNAAEDCLFLNIWAPKHARRAPVMVFIHGGGGSGAIPWWDGSSFARDGVVLITINYRNFSQGKFAHPALTRAAGPDEPLGRYDLMDQIAALAWVKRNIVGFGGDPDNVTLFGQSAGGAATLQLMTTPAAKGLFHKAIVQSGNGWWAPMEHAEYERFGAWLASQAGLPGEHATLEQLRSLPVDAMPWYGGFNIDGRLLPESPTEAFAAGRALDVPLMIGWTSFDGSSLRFADAEAVIADASPALRAAYSDDGGTTEDLGYAMYTDSHSGAPARWIAARTADGEPSYLYLFSYVRTADRGSIRGAAHSTDLPYVFDSWGKAAPNLPLTEEDRAVTRMVHSCWISFAMSGRPQCDDAPAWPRYLPEDDRLMELGTTAHVRQNFRREQLDAQTAAVSDTLNAQRRSLDELLSETVFASPAADD